MKKKILSLALIMVMLFSTMLVITGCGETKEDRTEKNKETNENNTSEVASTENYTNTEINKGIENEKNENSKKIYKLSEADSGNHMYVRCINDENDQNEYYIVDKTGKIVGNSFRDADAARVNGFQVMNNYIYGTAESHIYTGTGSGSTVYDIKGNVVLEKDEKTYYTAVSKNGYIGVYTKKKELQGESEVYKIADLKGNVIYEESSNPIYYIANDLFLIVVEYDKSILFDAKTGKKTEYDCERPGKFVFTNNSDWGVYDGEFVVNSDGTKGKKLMSGFTNVMDYEKEYILCDDKLADIDGKIIKDFSEGGMTKISYKDGKFAVVSKTGFYYVIDEKGKYVVEPMELKVEADNVYLEGNNVYVIENGIAKVYDYKLENEKQIASKIKEIGFIKCEDVIIIELTDNDGHRQYIDASTLEEFTAYF